MYRLSRKVVGNYVPKSNVMKQLQILAAVLAFSFISAPIQGFSQACEPAIVTAGGGSYGNEISWDITNSSGEIVASGNAGSQVVCLDLDDCLTVNLYDAFGDGWNGNVITIGDFFQGTIPGGSYWSYQIGPCEPEECLGSLLEVQWINPNNYDLGFNIENEATGEIVAFGDNNADGVCLDMQDCYSLLIANGSNQLDSSVAIVIGGQEFLWQDGANPGGFTSRFPLAIGCNAGCTDELACNFDSEAAQDNGSCQYPELVGLDCDGNFIEGCMYHAAINYNPYAVIEDGSCEFYPSECLAYGCTYMGACNYDAQADCDDGSCVFAAEGFDCAGNELGDDTDACGPGTHWDNSMNLCVVTLPMDGDFDGCVSMSDLLDLLSSFGTCLD